jgi:biotin synthase
MVQTLEAKRSNGHDIETVRTDWDRAEAEALYALPFSDLIFRAQSIHRDNFDPNHVETASLLSIKTGGCPEDCGYCAQSAHYETGLKATRLMDQADVVATARRARDAGATRFCMAAAWRNPKDRDLDKVCEMVSAVKGLGMETCVTLGMLTPGQAARLSDAGLDFYNHNVDTSPEFYDRIITTRTLQDRIDTAAVSWAWVNGLTIGWACWFCSPTCRAIRRACRSISGTRSRAFRSTTPRSGPTRSN